MDKREQVASLRKAILESSGYRLAQEDKALETSSTVYEGNFKDLYEFLLTITQVDLAIELWMPINAQRRKLAEAEIQRRFFNYLSAAFSFVAHSTKYIEDHADDTFVAEYRKRVKDSFADNNLHCFLKKLRNYSQHFAIPVISHRLHFGFKQEEQYWCVIEKSHLLSWDGWDRRSKEWLDTQPDHIRLLDVICEHHDNIVSFNTWFFDALSKAHAVEIELTNEIIKEHNRVLSE